MKALVTCSELSDIKFEDFTFDVSPSLFLNHCELELATEILTEKEIDYDSEWEKFSVDYEVHKSQILHRELVDRGILSIESVFMDDFNSDDMILSPKEFLDKIYLKFQITIFK
jgi:hypothetical protein